MFFLVAVLLLAGGVVAKDKVLAFLDLSGEITQTQSILLKAKGYDNASYTELTCEGSICNYNLYINGSKMKTNPIPFSYQEFNTETNLTDTIYYSDAGLHTMQEAAIKSFYQSEYARFAIQPTVTKKGEEKEIDLDGSK